MIDKIVATGGGFDPLHIGHINLFREAKKLGDLLVVMLNSDSQVMKKKGFVFMPLEERKAILESIKYVDLVIIDLGEDVTCEKALLYVKPDILAKGGDRDKAHMPQIEINVCEEIDCKIIYNVGGNKVQSSSRLARRVKCSVKE